MTLAKKIFKGSIIITSGEVIAQVCSLLRNVILARVLTKADFGVAAILGMTISIFEIGGRLSIEYCLIQSKDGDQPKFMAVAHFIQAALGLISSLLIFVVGWKGIITICKTLNLPSIKARYLCSNAVPENVTVRPLFAWPSI